MFNKVEFSDLYKFQTSVGLLIIASAFLIPWLFMKQDIGLLISRAEYNSLIPDSKDLVDDKIVFGTIIIKTLPWISGFLFLVGSIITGRGIVKWKEKQRKIDKSDNIKVAKEELEFKQLSPEEVKEKAVDEVKKGMQYDVKENKSNDYNITNEPEEEYIGEMANNLINVEKIIFDKFSNIKSRKFDVISNVLLDYGVKIDIYLKSINPEKFNDAVVEITYLQKNLDKLPVYESFFNLSDIYNQLNSYFDNRAINTYLIVVFKEGITSNYLVNLFKEQVYKLEGRGIMPFMPIVISDKEIKDLDVQRLLNL
ncbi:hypothetical protein ACOSP6_10895 [Tenacibaculum sp. MEBiC06402]|uniref:hypothetical protein n=1 Tax=unclassified Tenacibaculum TaxID=2635139 RepID=UPI003B9A71B2